MGGGEHLQYNCDNVCIFNGSHSYLFYLGALTQMFSLRQFVKVLIIEFIENGIGIQVHTVVLTIAYYGHFYSKKT